MKKVPIKCKSIEDVCKMSRDNINLPSDFWFCFDGCEITIAEQKLGESARQKCSIPKQIFDKCVRWYLTGNKNGKI